MPGLGTVFVELNLDKSKFEASQRRLLQDVSKVSLDVEKNMQTLGSHSAQTFDLMRQRVQNAYESIAHSARASAEERLQAERLYNQQLKSIQDQQYGIQLSFMEKLKKNWLATTAAITAAYLAARKAWDLAEQSSQYEQSAMSFRSMVQSMGRDAEAEFAKIKQASAGLVDDKALVESANKAMSLGISVESLAGLMEISRAKARDMGTDTAQAFNDIAIGIGRASPKILDNLGIMIKIESANREYAASIGKATDALTDHEKQQAVANAVIKAGTEALSRHNLEVKTNKEKMDSLKATLKDVELLLGQGIIRATAGAVAAWRSLNSASMALSSGLWKIVEAYDSFMSKITFGEVSESYRQAANYARQQSEADWTMAEKYWAMAKDNFDLMVSSSSDLATAMQNAGTAAEDAGDDGSDAAKKLQEQWESTRKTLEAKVQDSGLDPFEQKLNEIYRKADELQEKFKEVAGASTVISVWKLTSEEEAAIAQGKKDFEAYLQMQADARAIESERGKELRDALKTEKEQLSEYEEFWKHTMENIHDATADAFYEIFDNVEDGWQTVIDNIKTWFLKLLAEMAAMAIARPIVLPIVTGLASSLGISGAASAATGGGTSPLDLSGVSGLYSALTSGGSAGWSLTNGPLSILETQRAGTFGNINWGAVTNYVSLAYDAYNIFKSIGDQKWGTTATSSIAAAATLITGNPLVAVVSSLASNIVGSFIDGLIESEPTFTLAEHNIRYTSGTQAQWTSGTGIGTGYWPEFATDWEAVPTVQYTAIAKAYAKGRKELAETFNTNMLAFLEALPEEYATAAEEALQNVDFGYLIPSGEWDFSNAEEVVTQLLQGYASFLDQVSEDLIRTIGKQYFTGEIATSDLFGNLTSSTQTSIRQMFTGGEMTAEDFSAFLEDWQTLAGVMSSFEAFIDPAATALTTYEQTVQTTGDTFDAYISTMRQAGVDIEKYIGSEQELADLRQSTINQAIAAMQKETRQDWASFARQYSGMSEYDIQRAEFREQMQTWKDTLTDLGLWTEYESEWNSVLTAGLQQITDSESGVTDALEASAAALEDFASWTDSMSETLRRLTMTGWDYAQYEADTQFRSAVDQLGEWLELGIINEQEYRDSLAMAKDVYTIQSNAATALRDAAEQQLAGALSLMSGGTAGGTMGQIAQRYGWSSYGSRYILGGGLYDWENIIDEIVNMNLTIEKLQYIADHTGISVEQLIEDIDYLAQTFAALKAEAAATAKSLEDQYRQATMSSEDYQSWKALQTYNETMQQIQEWYQEGVIGWSDYSKMRQYAAGIYDATIQDIAEAERDNLIDIIKSAYDAWDDLADSIGSSILSMKTSTDSQADAAERLGIQAQAIRDYTGGMSLETYLGTLATDEDRQNAIREYMDLYGGYLSLAQEAYQRPSSEYQAIYEEVLSAYQHMETLANSYKTDYDIQVEQLDVLRIIAANTGLYGSYDTGTDYVPRTGPYLLHQGERVTPAGQTGGVSVSFGNIVFNGVRDGSEAVSTFKGFLKSPVFRKAVQEAAAGR